MVFSTFFLDLLEARRSERPAGDRPFQLLAPWCSQFFEIGIRRSTWSFLYRSQLPAGATPKFQLPAGATPKFSQQTSKTFAGVVPVHGSRGEWQFSLVRE